MVEDGSVDLLRQMWGHQAMTDFVAALARTWCPSHGESAEPNPRICACQVLVAAIREALAASAKICRTHLYDVGNALPAIKAAQASGDVADAVLKSGDILAVAIRALREGR